MALPRIVLAYSGGLNTSVAIPWLTERYGADIVTVTLDVGQGTEISSVRESALATGAVRAHVVDAREEFARDYVLRGLQAGAVYEGRYSLATALSRPLLATHLMKILRIEGATAVAHGCDKEGSDQMRIDQSLRALDPSVEVLAPAREWEMTHAETIDYARKHGIPATSSESPYSIDLNLWGRAVQYGVLDDAWREPPEEVYLLTRSPAEAPDVPAYLEIAFERGVPVSANGVSMPLVELIYSVETIAGAHGVGRVDMVENRQAGVKSREIYEAPAATVLHAAHMELQKFVTPRDLERLTSELGVKYADLVYNGQWHAPTREAIDALVGKVQERVTGAIRLKLFKGQCLVVGRHSPFALYETEAAATSSGERKENGASVTKAWRLPLEKAARKALKMIEPAAPVKGRE